MIREKKELPNVQHDQSPLLTLQVAPSWQQCQEPLSPAAKESVRGVKITLGMNICVLDQE